MMASTEVVPEIAVAEPVQEKMKSHGIMNQVMARLLSEDHKKEGILSLVSSTAGVARKSEHDGVDKKSLKRPRSVMRTSGSGADSDDGEEEEEEEVEEAEDTEARTGVASGMGMPTERGSVPAEKIDVVKSCHVLPSSSALELERALQRVATGAVVQLFNAVSKHQKDIESKLKEAGKSERKKTKILSSVDKNDFLAHLKAGNKAQSNKTDPGSKQPLWSVLRDDFTKGSKLKDWDTVGQTDGTAPAAGSSDTDDSDM